MEIILKNIFEAVIRGESDSVQTLVQEALTKQIPSEKILNDGLITAMKEVGDRFEQGEFYVPEMLIAARAMKAGLTILRPTLVQQGVESAGTVVIGTVKGDLHDIGKNLVAMMLEGAGFEIIDLGADVSPESFTKAIRENRAAFVGMSALLTTTMQGMKTTIAAMQDLGVRDEVKIIIGGAPVTEAYAKEIGADGYAADASRAVALVRSLS